MNDLYFYTRIGSLRLPEDDGFSCIVTATKISLELQSDVVTAAAGALVADERGRTSVR